MSTLHFRQIIYVFVLLEQQFALIIPQQATELFAEPCLSQLSSHGSYTEGPLAKVMGGTEMTWVPAGQWCLARPGPGLCFLGHSINVFDFWKLLEDRMRKSLLSPVGY